MSTSNWFPPHPPREGESSLASDISMKDATPLLTFDDSFDSSTADPDQLLFGPLDMEDNSLFSHPTSSQWDGSYDLSYPSMTSPTFTADASSNFYGSSLSNYSPHGINESPYLGSDDFSRWLNEPEVVAAEPLSPASSSAPIPIRSAPSGPQTPPAFVPYGHHGFSGNVFSPAAFAALHPLPRSLSPSESEGYLSSPAQPVLSISPSETSLTTPTTPAWATQLWDNAGEQQPEYVRPQHRSRQQRLSETSFTARRPPIPFRRDLSSGQEQFTSSSAPSHMQMGIAAQMRSHGWRAESVSSNEDRDATVRRKKRLSPEDAPVAIKTEEVKEKDTSPQKSVLKPPKLAPSAWQLYFTDWIQRHQQTSTRKLNVAQAAKEAGQEYAELSPAEKEPYKRKSAALKQERERQNAEYMKTLTPDDIKRENAYRTAQRKAGKSRKSNLKDPNAPKKPLSAYFMFLQRIRSDPALVRDVFGDEQETTKQSVLAAAKWRDMSDDERKPFLARAEQEKLEYEAARRLYEEGTPALGTNINFSILPQSTDSPFSTIRPIKTESFGSFTSDG